MRVQNRVSNGIVRGIAFAPDGNLRVMTSARASIFGLGVGFPGASCSKGLGGTRGTGGAPGPGGLRHVSQFVRPGAKVVATSGGDALAFKNVDGSIVAVMYNSGSSAMDLVSLGREKLQFSRPGNGGATVDYVP